MRPALLGLAGRAVWAAWSTSWQAAHPWRTGLTLLPSPSRCWCTSLAPGMAVGEGTRKPAAGHRLVLRHLGPGGYRADTTEPSPLRATRTAASHCDASGHRRRVDRGDGGTLPPCYGLGSLLRVPLLPPGVLTAKLVTAIALWQRRWIPGLGVLMTLATFVVIWQYDRLPRRSRKHSLPCVAVVLAGGRHRMGRRQRLLGAAMQRTVRATRSCRRFASFQMKPAASTTPLLGCGDE